MKERKKFYPIFLLMLCASLIAFSFILSKSTVNYIVLFVCLILTLIYVEWKRLVLEINSLFNINNLFETEFEETKKVLKFLIFSITCLGLFYTFLSVELSDNIYSTITNGSTVILTAMYISLIDTYFEAYINEKVTNKDEDFEKKVKSDSRLIKIISSFLMLLLLLTILIMNTLNGLLKENNLLDVDKSNIKFNEKNKSIDTNKSYIQLKNGKKYILEESDE
ncbi:hypothetical protein [Staphylococcus hominis]|uniref:hypothetical protein n=1 Tax=Staphylococcus hominis TaxID=1290 RepID=UPI00066CDD9E|nr:hypothetical protein [Staphylococcus hominis]